MHEVNGVRIRGTGSCVPSRVLRNADFPASLDTSDEWIRTRTGIRERRLCGPEDTAASLGLTASSRALEAAGLTATDLDLIVCATISADKVVPSAACMIQAGLGCRPIAAFDINAACSGFLYALAVGEQFLRAGSARTALVVGSDTMSRMVDFTNRNTCVLFGDGAGAVVLSAEAGRPLNSYRLYADGSRGSLIRLDGISNRTPAVGLTAAAACQPEEYLRMNGREVFKFAVHSICELVRDALVDGGLTPADIDLVVPHQVNQRIIDSAFSTLGFPAEKLMVNLDRYGNTSAASVPIALDEALREGRAKPGDRILLLAFGGGLTWSSAVLRV